MLDQILELLETVRTVPHRRRISKSAVPDQWASYSFLSNGFRLVTTDKPQDHWQGGTPKHKNASCPLCRMPLHLIWDINLTDSRFPQWLRDRFAPISRLPLYYCCRCPPENIYRVLTEDRIKTIRPSVVRGYDPQNDPNEESPFTGYPDAFPRRRIIFEQIPDDVSTTLSTEDEYGFESLSLGQVKRLSDYLDREVTSSWDLTFSQFGGLPMLIQKHRENVCPNPQCLAHMSWYPYSQHENQFLMKELAVVDDDANLGMDRSYAQIAFYICWCCLTIRSEYRCS